LTTTTGVFLLFFTYVHPNNITGEMFFLRCSSQLISVVFILSLFQRTALAVSYTFDIRKNHLISRQDASISCDEYSMIANYSTIGLNSTYRAAFMKASPHGTDATTAILDGASKKLPDMKFNKLLNDECGNLTTLAKQDAATNFTNGIVGPFTIKAINAGVKLESSSVLVVVVLLTMMGATGL
jgi:hypothetical protein